MATIMSNTTRYLCAAGYLDTRFREAVLRELTRDPYRGVAPSAGDFDVVPVVRHCLRARRLMAYRDLLVSLVIAAGMVLDFWRMVSWLVVLGGFVWFRHSRRGGPVVVMTLGVLLMVKVPWLEALVSGQPVDLGTMPVGMSAIALTLVVVAGFRVRSGVILAKRLRAGAAAPPVDDPRLDYLARAQHGNLTLSKRAFIGWGEVRETWPAPGLEPPEGTDVFVAPGVLEPTSPLLDHARPVITVTEGARCYRRVVLQDDEIIVTAFLRADGRYGEVVVTVLPPVADDYRLADLLPRGLVKIARGALSVRREELAVDVLLAPLRLVRLLAPKARRPDVAHDYGARLSVRELGAGPLTCLQELDVQRQVTQLRERLQPRTRLTQIIPEKIH
ncbi:hypothetical protein FDA94_16405 [Herbidospora galbida]|uniref:Uncharacterized protein n=1 Tax=Herbidospora galbida TaxID=2575442 RepID=A0A4U3MGP1_9ACTN|nr:hypothetical protein [Herbidospora galbida]TKK87759.1 hypothetical protein FDA94_16405 [Herbidospora galbida]